MSRDQEVKGVIVRATPTSCSSSSCSQVTSCCPAVTIRKHSNLQTSRRSAQRSEPSSTRHFKAQKTERTASLPTSLHNDNSKKRILRKKRNESFSRTSSIASIKSKDSGVSDCELQEKMKTPRERYNYKITKQVRRGPDISSSSRQVDCENNIVKKFVDRHDQAVSQCQSENVMSHVNVMSHANVMSRPFLEVIEDLCGDCDNQPDRRNDKQIRRISLSSERKIDIKQFFCFSRLWGKVKKFLPHKAPVIEPFKCEHNQLFQIHSKFDHLGPIRLSLVHRSCSGSNTKLSKERVSPDTLWYAYLAISVKESKKPVAQRVESCVSCGRIFVLSAVVLQRCADCRAGLCRLCASLSPACYHCTQVRSLGWTGCSWLLSQLRRKFRLMEAVSVHGQRRVEGLVGLVRQHCETVMGSMLGSGLDMVNIELREDWVSQAIYSRYQPRLADKLATFTSVLATMENVSNIHMELRHLITTITENVIDAKFREVFMSIRDTLRHLEIKLQPRTFIIDVRNVGQKTYFSDLELNGNIDIPSKTYEDILAIALINLILSKYNEDLQEENPKMTEPFNPPSNEQRNAFSQTEQLRGTTVRGAAAGRLQLKTMKTNNNNNNNNNYCQMKDENSESSSLTSTSSDSSSSTSSDSVSSTFSTTSISSSELSYESPAQLSDTVYDGCLGLYLSNKKEEDIYDNWILKPQQKNTSFDLHRENVKQSLKTCLVNLTDDLKEEMEQRNIDLLCALGADSDVDNNQQTDCEYTETQFHSVLGWHWAPALNVYSHNQRFYLQLGEEIGESSTDFEEEQENILPVNETIQLFESLTNGNSPDLLKGSKLCPISDDCEEIELDISNEVFQVVFPSVKVLALKFQTC